MIGLSIASIYTLILIASRNSFEQAYLKASRFLFYWYIAFAVLYLLFWLGIMSTGSLIMNFIFGPVIALLGLGVSTLIVMVSVIALSFFQVLGAYFAKTAIAKNGEKFDWNMLRLIIGWLFILIGILNFLS